MLNTRLLVTTVVVLAQPLMTQVQRKGPAPTPRSLASADSSVSNETPEGRIQFDRTPSFRDRTVGNTEGYTTQSSPQDLNEASTALGRRRAQVV
jgi:hypothetical protein